MKKICIITTVSITLKSFVVATAKHLHETCGYDVTLICNEDPAFAASLPEGIRYIPVHMDRGAKLSGFSAIRKLMKIFQQEKFDLVQYATPNASCYASIAAFLARVPVRLYCQWGIRYVGFYGIKRIVFKTIEKLTCLLSTDIRAASQMNKDFSVMEKLYCEDKAKVVGNGGTIGVDMSSFDVLMKDVWRHEIRQKHGIQADDFVFGFSGRVTIDKGCSELLGAFKEVQEKVENAKLLIVGPMDVDCEIDNDLCGWARESENIIFTGLVPQSDMPKYYAAMDVLVHPTYREGFGMVIQEAGAMAVPVITTKIPGASEVMEDGDSCILVEPKNVEGLTMAMGLLAEKPEYTKKLGAAALERTRKLYERNVRLLLQESDYICLLKGGR